MFVLPHKLPFKRVLLLNSEKVQGKRSIFLNIIHVWMSKPLQLIDENLYNLLEGVDNGFVVGIF